MEKGLADLAIIIIKETGTKKTEKEVVEMLKNKAKTVTSFPTPL